MAERDPVTGRWVSSATAPAPAEDPTRAEGRNGRESTSAPPLFRLRLEAEDVAPPPAGGQAAPGDESVGPEPGGPELEHEEAVKLVRGIVEGIDGGIGVGLGDPYRATPEELDKLADVAEPVARRGLRALHAEELADHTLPAWLVELVKLGAYTYVAWGDAIAETWRRSVDYYRMRRADERSDDADVDPDVGPASRAARAARRVSSDDGRRRRPGGDDRAGVDLADDDQGRQAGQNRPDRPGENGGPPVDSLFELGRRIAPRTSGGDR
jgi:hypothetical protein